MMHRAIRSVVGSPRAAYMPLDLPSEVGRLTGSVRFRQSEPENQGDNMEKTKIQNKSSSFVEKDGMSSFGDAYATRSDEEGFGGIYGANQSLGKNRDEENEGAQENQDCDRNQGSDVKEKEKTRHQKEKGPHDHPSCAK